MQQNWLVRPKIIVNTFSFLLFFTANFCGKKNQRQFHPPQESELTSGVTHGDDEIVVIFEPFETEKVNTIVILPLQKSSYVWSPPKVIPGFHSSWDKQAQPSSIAVSEDQGTTWVERTFKAGETISPGIRLKYRSLALKQGDGFNRWRSITGWVGPSSGLLMITSLLNLTPSEASSPIRVILKTREPLERLETHGRKCDSTNSCVLFSNYLEALDSPIAFYAQNHTDLPAIGSDDLRIIPVGLSERNSSKEFRESFVEIGKSLESAWQYFKSKLGLLDLRKMPYHSYLIPYEGCQFLGLEHNNSNVAAIDASCPDAVSKVRVGVTHEMIHAWNVKRIAPRSHSQFNLLLFSDSRLELIFFYEGFTEGLARLFSSFQFQNDEMETYLINTWNSSFSSAFLQAVGVGNDFSIATLGQRFPALGYQLGALLVLELALLSDKDPAGAIEQVTQVIRALGGSNQGGSTSRPSWEKQTLMNFLVKTKEGEYQGYLYSDIIKAIRQVYGQKAAEPVITSRLEKQSTFGSRADLLNLLQKLAQKVGGVVDTHDSFPKLKRPSPGAKLKWPL